MAFLIAPSHVGKLISDAAAFQRAIIDDPQLISRDPVMRQYQDVLVNRSVSIISDTSTTNICDRFISIRLVFFFGTKKYISSYIYRLSILLLLHFILYFERDRWIRYLISLNIYCYLIHIYFCPVSFTENTLRLSI